MENILEMNPVWKVRSNHGLEHATLHVLSSKVTRTRMGGLSDAGGFWLVGNVPTDLIFESAQEALERLQAGEVGLAKHDNCGSNLVPSILLSSGLAFLSLVGTAGNMKKRARRVPLAVLMGLIGFQAAKPMGPVLQEQTVSTDHFDQMSVREIRNYQPNGLMIHRVFTDFQEA